MDSFPSKFTYFLLFLNFKKNIEYDFFSDIFYLQLDDPNIQYFDPEKCLKNVTINYFAVIRLCSLNPKSMHKNKTDRS